MPSKKAQRRAAARKARAARGPLSDDARQRLRDAIKARRPWDRATGPRTEAGKARSRRNAIRAGFKSDAATLPPLVAQLLTELRAAERGGPLPSYDLACAASELAADKTLPEGVRVRAMEIRSWWNRLFFQEVERLNALHRAGLLPGW